MDQNRPNGPKWTESTEIEGVDLIGLKGTELDQIN